MARVLRVPFFCVCYRKMSKELCVLLAHSLLVLMGFILALHR